MEHENKTPDVTAPNEAELVFSQVVLDFADYWHEADKARNLKNAFGQEAEYAEAVTSAAKYKARIIDKIDRARPAPMADESKPFDHDAATEIFNLLESTSFLQGELNEARERIAEPEAQAARYEAILADATQVRCVKKADVIWSVEKLDNEWYGYGDKSFSVSRTRKATMLEAYEALVKESND